MKKTYNLRKNHIRQGFQPTGIFQHMTTHFNQSPETPDRQAFQGKAIQSSGDGFLRSQKLK
jgi:hypothetical protein